MIFSIQIMSYHVWKIRQRRYFIFKWYRSFPDIRCIDRKKLFRIFYFYWHNFHVFSSKLQFFQYKPRSNNFLLTSFTTPDYKSTNYHSTTTPFLHQHLFHFFFPYGGLSIYASFTFSSKTFYMSPCIRRPILQQKLPVRKLYIY